MVKGPFGFLDVDTILGNMRREIFGWIGAGVGRALGGAIQEGIREGVGGIGRDGLLQRLLR